VKPPSGLLLTFFAATLIFTGACALVRGVAPVPSLYLALGDSLAVGIGSTAPLERGYAAQVGRWLQREAVERVDRTMNLAIGGETSETLVSSGQLSAALDTIRSPDTDVRVVTLDIGGNDLLGLLFNGPCGEDPTGPGCQAAVQAAQARFADSYRRILAALADALANEHRPGRLVVATYYNPFSGTGTPYEAPSDVALLGSDGVVDCSANASDPTRIGLNDLIACIGIEHGAVVADTYPAFAQRGPELTNIAERDIHANDAGHAVFADVIKEALEALG